ncbi:hypothetical protein BGI41_00345 [Methanobrevibacter sp. 87.7]|uniref:DUF3795 domain-containing protein n=1 Tax=Methanobrevibacter sp. 87.7 TaxID=387957 RepID=UPI000B5007E9|nr:DUF3795 domain-containing protein [Methanobrevibacter sp. 87.7]OWT33844.1 hypothetical protein BGI41_00345 [Methanobrevibacter sp. 87.7]
MEMPEKIDTNMFAPCGINCQLCEKHVKKTNPCPGCLIKGSNKTKSVLKCKIRECLNKKTVKYCGRCSEFPCKLIKKQDKNNIKRYNYSSLESAKRIKNTGIKRMMDEDRKKWTCDECNGIITIQNKECSECGKKF